MTYSICNCGMSQKFCGSVDSVSSMKADLSAIVALQKEIHIIDNQLAVLRKDGASQENIDALKDLRTRIVARLNELMPITK